MLLLREDLYNTHVCLSGCGSPHNLSEIGALPIITLTLARFFIFLEKIKTGLLATNFSIFFPTIFRFPVLARHSHLWFHSGTHIGSVPPRLQASGTTPISLLSALALVLLNKGGQKDLYHAQHDQMLASVACQSASKMRV